MSLRLALLCCIAALLLGWLLLAQGLPVRQWQAISVEPAVLEQAAAVQRAGTVMPGNGNTLMTASATKPDTVPAKLETASFALG